MRRYFVTDLDGTLLQSNGLVSEFTAKVVNRALDEGQVISFATARSWGSAASGTSAIHWKHPVIVYNGVQIIDPLTGVVLAAQLLPEEVCNAVFSQGLAFDIAPLIFGRDSSGQERIWHEPSLRYGPHQFKSSRLGDSRFMVRSPLRVFPHEQVMMITYIAEEDLLVELQERLTKRLRESVHIHWSPDIYLRPYGFLEVTHPGASKEMALQTWLRLVHGSADAVTVFGDNFNDLGMFEVAGHSVSVANGVEALKAVASEVIGHHDEDAVARYLARKLWNGQEGLGFLRQ